MFKEQVCYPQFQLITEKDSRSAPMWNIHDLRDCEVVGGFKSVVYKRHLCSCFQVRITVSTCANDVVRQVHSNRELQSNITDID